MARRARVLLLTEDEHDHRQVHHLVEAGILPLRAPWVLAPTDLGSLPLTPDLVVAVGRSGTLPAARLRERLGLPGARPRDVLTLLDRGLLRRRAREVGVPIPRPLSAIGARNWHFRSPLAARTGDEVRRVAEPADLPLDGEVSYEEWIDAEVCHVDGVAVGGRVVTAVASRYLGTRHDFAAGAGMGGVTIEDTEAAPLLAAAELTVSRLSIPDGAFHVELFDAPGGPILLGAAPHPPDPVLRAMVRAATGVDLVAEHIRAGVGQPTYPRRTRAAVAGYWRIPPRPPRQPGSRPTLPDLHSDVVLATLPQPAGHGPTEVVIAGTNPARVLTDLLSLRERLDEQVGAA
ncbi:hypothetical protein [Actinophytocola xanthii]|uniref:ATP-grasp domain-containing protein n=1 Tax=Actinophytocola xanthii TaxID=1912961 RepID=A0A1Q8CUM2_9PSEU|nr:hypothetical protein [Actinophytocola xanthii]OLF18046.1 hypothetical protein BU204_07810 [Actinophytocola xanthii]